MRLELRIRRRESGRGLRTLELLLGVEVDLLRLRNLLDDLLDHDAVVDAYVSTKVSKQRPRLSQGDPKETAWLQECEGYVRRRELDVVVGLDDIDVQLLLARRQKHALVDLELQVPQAGSAPARCVAGKGGRARLVDSWAEDLAQGAHDPRLLARS